MIPRLKPFLGSEELLTIFKKKDRAVREFEDIFARQFQTKFAISFPYGRSALWAFFKALDINDSEIVQPAYTCSVVAHATVLSENTPVFVDNNLFDYNMDLAQFANAITHKTRAVIPTHLFGYPMDINKVQKIVQSAEKKFGHKIWVIQDCAHSFQAKWREKSIINAGDGAIFGLGISKLITSVFGGMFTTDDAQIAEKVRSFRNENFKQPVFYKGLLRFLYLLAVYPAFNPEFYGLVYWLQEKTPFLNQLTRAYHLDEKIHFPPDYLDHMTSTEALVGIEQSKKYLKIISKRQATAAKYFEQIPETDGFILPPQIDGATYSHFVIRTRKRDKMLKYFAKRSIQLGQLIEYSMPHHPAYVKHTNGKEFPNSFMCSQSLVNLPIYPNLKNGDKDAIISLLKRYMVEYEK